MKLNQRKENYYAFSIGANPSSKNKRRQNFSFKTLTGNFYTDLINSDLSIKRGKKTLSLIKNKTIKESIYSNRDIPKSWKTMLGYSNEVYKAIDQDPNFAYYVGASTKKENKVNQFFGTKLMNVNNLNTGSNKEQNKKFVSLENIDKYIKENNLDEDLNNDKEALIERNNDVKLYNKTISFNERSNERRMTYHLWGINNALMNSKLNDKFFSSKLDDYRTKYDIDKFTENVKHKIKEIHLDVEDDNYTRKINENKNKNYYRQFLKDQTKNNKESVLKKTIYSNLIPEKEERKKFYKTLYDSNKTIESHRFKRNKNYTPFKTMPIFENREKKFNEVIINDKIKRDLELINYFGPNYSNCLVCRKRNMDFYANSEPKQTMILLSYLKKIKLNGKRK